VKFSLQHLTCFLPGLLALGSVSIADTQRAATYMRLAKQLMHTCYRMYSSTAAGLSPEHMSMAKSRPFVVPDEAPYHMLRPEAVESLFVLHQLTGDQEYREWGWAMFEAIEKRCKVEHGYGHYSDVRNPSMPAEDKIESFFMAETLKYHYLLQHPGQVSTGGALTPLIDLRKWVFNTEAHPLPIN
jgi:mannosyl-oligosaccharide alpha-1,2-mannosidase